MLRNVIWVIVVLGLGVALGNWWSTTPATQDEHEHAAAAQVWRCPMHPTVVSDTGGSCPVCGMDLVADAAPVAPATHAASAAASGTVQIDPVTRQNIGVRTAPVQRRVLQRNVRVAGRVEYDETRMSDVNTKVAGWVEHLSVAVTGQMVKKGEPLLEIYSPELVAAQAEYLTVLEYVERLAREAADMDVQRGAHELLDASRQRLRYWDVSDSQVDHLRQTRAVSRTLTIHSPQEGVVVHKAVFEGAYINPGEHLYRIADLSTVWVSANVYESELPWIAIDQYASATLTALPGRVLQGRVVHMHPSLDLTTRSLMVRMNFDNADRALRPGMYASVVIHTDAVERLAVPAEAVIRTGERSVVVVDLGEGRFQPTNVQTGLSSEGWDEVLAGVQDGDRVVTSAQFLIDSESNLKAALSDMTAASDEAGATPTPVPAPAHAH